VAKTDSGTHAVSGSRRETWAPALAIPLRSQRWKGSSVPDLRRDLCQRTKIQHCNQLPISPRTELMLAAPLTVRGVCIKRIPPR